MKKPVVLSIVGARPQFIKLAPLSRELGSLSHRILHTGQHYDPAMSLQFFSELRIEKPYKNLAVGSGSHGKMTGGMLVAIESELAATRPDLVIVYGDTNSTLAGALAAAKLAISIAHVEAGMRSFVRDTPEEINRRLVDHLASLHFCASEQAEINLRREGITEGIVRTGDLMYEQVATMTESLSFASSEADRAGFAPFGYLVVTLHRAAATDSREELGRFVTLVRSLDFPLLFPVHPRTRAKLRQAGLLDRLSESPHITLCEPLGYRAMLTAVAFSYAIMTDSGGLQKEALALGTPVLTLRTETEWVETLSGGNRIVGFDIERIQEVLMNPPLVSRIEWKVDGKRPSELIARSICDFLSGAAQSRKP